MAYRPPIHKFISLQTIQDCVAEVYGGGFGNMSAVETTPAPSHGRPASLVLTLPPLGVLVLERDCAAA